MSIKADTLIGTQRELVRDGRSGWFVAKPIAGPFICRWRDAVQVLRGTAVAVTFEEDESEKETVRC